MAGNGLKPEGFGFEITSGWLGFSGKLFFFFQTCFVHTDLGFVQVKGYEWSKHLKMTTHGFPKFQVEELGE